MNNTVLSFLVVTHNHASCISRCLDSILNLKLSYAFEIIVGDDSSTDNTWEIIRSYKREYPTLFSVYQIDSNDIHPIITSERAGYNRACGYKLIRGKYFVEIDGDDYLIENDTYQRQVDLLEANENCSLCLQNMISKDANSCQRTYNSNKFYTGRIITAQEYLSDLSLFSQHQAFMFRRNEKEDPSLVLGRHYEDTTITLFHLQFGSIICLNEGGYVYVVSDNGINRQLTNDNRLVVLTLLHLEHISLFPKFAGIIFKSAIDPLIHLLKITCRRKISLTEDYIHHLSFFEGFLFKYYQTSNHSPFMQVRLLVLRLGLLVYKKLKIRNSRVLRLLYVVATNRTNSRFIPYEYWKI